MTISQTPNLPPEIVDWDPQIFSLNTNGFANSHRYILQHFASKHDVTFIQETRFQSPSIQERVTYHWQRITNHEGLHLWESPLYPAAPTLRATGGLATFIHPHSPLRNAVVVPNSNAILRARYQQIRCTLGPATIVLHNVYAPVAWSDRAPFFAALPRDFPPHFLHIVGGDFNCTLNPDLDSMHATNDTMAGTTELLDWTRNLSIVDIFRQQCPLKRVFTSPKLINRLDYIFCSTPLAQLTHWKAKHVPHIPQADHVACQIVTKRQAPAQHGSGSWKAPSWLLRLPQASAIIHRSLDRFLARSPSFHNIGRAYDTLVKDIRDQLKALHTQYVEKQKLPAKRLTIELASLLQVPNLRQDQVLVERVRGLQKQIHDLQEQQKQFRQEQAFQLHLHKAERTSKFHFQSPIPLPLRKTMFKSLETADGTLVTDQSNIANTLVDFYSDLYKAQVSHPPEVISSFLQPLTSNKQLSLAAQRELGAPFLANDFYHAIKHSSKNSAPGPNSLPYEVLQLAPHKWALVLELLFDQQLHQRDSLTPLQLVSTLVLLHKKGPKTLAKNYRPISLLNVDVKLLTSILAFRLQKHIKSIVHPDQQGFIKGCNIMTNIQRLEDMMHYMKLYSPSSMVALLDFEKAFDRVDHHYLQHVLQHYGFPQVFLDVIQVIYTNRRSRILVNGRLSNPFCIQRGVLQGDPLSPLLFVLALEPMCQLLRQHAHYGIKTGSRTHTGSFFADDSQLYAGNEKSLTRQLALVQSFCDISGFKLNIDKTQILTFAALSSQYQHLAVSMDNPTKALGIWVAPDLPYHTRFQQVFDRLVARLQLWQYKARTLPGKVAILNFICLPVLWYQLTFVPPDKNLARKIDRVMLQFLHGEEINASAKSTGLRLIKQELVFLSATDGGLGLHHAHDVWSQYTRAHMLRCIPALLTSPTPSWIMPGYCLLDRAFHPWGSPRDLLFASDSSSFIRKLLKSPCLTATWSSFVTAWFGVRLSPQGVPSNHLSWDVPLWHNAFLPGLESLYDHFSRAQQDQALSLAYLKITKVSHLLTPSGQLWSPEYTHSKLESACTRSNVLPPTLSWIRQLMSYLEQHFDYASEATMPAFKLPTGNTPTVAEWLIRPDDVSYYLPKVTTKAARVQIKTPLAAANLIPTKHLRLPPSFYQDPKRLSQLVNYHQAPHILPRYGDFMFKMLLRANAMQYMFQYLDPKPACIFCGNNETYLHFLLSCSFGQTVWQPFKQVQHLLGCAFPRNVQELFFDTPLPPDNYDAKGYRYIWPIIRACVYYQIWLERVDRIFRPDLTPKTASQVALKAASLIKLHFDQMLVDLPIKKGYSKVFNILRKLCTHSWLKTFMIPENVGQ